MLRELKPQEQALITSIRRKREKVIIMARGNARERDAVVDALRIIVNKALPEGYRIGKQRTVPFDPRVKKEFKDTVAKLPADRPDIQDFDDDEEREEEDEKYDGSGKGNRLETRGLSTLRKNYGFRDSESEQDSDSESDGDALDFDDRRNEHYYTRPAGRPHGYM